MSASVSSRYRALTRSGELEPDAAQMALAERFDTLVRALDDRRLAAKSSVLGWLFGRRQAARAVRGVYVHGDVGRGKTMLADLFVEAVTVRRRRAHFNDFMADVHERIHEHRQSVKRGGAGAQDDPIPPVAAALAAEARVVCLDELHVDDIADAMILGRLFAQLFARGVVLVATSNAAPDELYPGGLNRPLFLPFVELIHEHMDVFRLAAATDYRLEKLRGVDVWFAPADASADAAVDAAWTRLVGPGKGEAIELRVKGRSLVVPQARRGVARFSFAQLCEAPLGTNDYLALARNFHTVLIDHIPAFDPARRNEARRFVLLVDTLYDARVKLVASAHAEPDALYPKGPLAPEFRRTASRLVEMRGRDYLAAAHGSRVGEEGVPDRRSATL